MEQIVFSGTDAHKKIEQILDELHSSKYLLVCDASFPYLTVKEYFAGIRIPHVIFNDFTPNPLYEDVCKGVDLFNREQCDAIVAVGGGSTLDVAKCIKLYAKMDPAKNYLEQPCFDSKIPLIALPTTAGTGSESTRYAVIYYDGKKQSVAHHSIVPDYAILEPGVLKTLPLYQKKCTLLDALCQGIESWWSVNSTEESKSYSKLAVETILQYKDAYLRDDSDEAAEKILLASNYAGRAINITQTTAPHAMSYKLTSLYKLPHGHAVAVCLPKVWRYMLDHTEQCVDARGGDYLAGVFADMAAAWGAASPAAAIDAFEKMLSDWGMNSPVAGSREQELAALTESVNPTRLKNNPIALDSVVLRHLYERIVN